eukprot:m.304467 g.304467  ORF g.304467 m.304467 type:complete len:620 (+) comp16930_c0_seq1:249-2108(+)
MSDPPSAATAATASVPAVPRAHVRRITADIAGLLVALRAFCEREKREGEPVLLENVVKRLAAMTGLSESTVSKVFTTLRQHNNDLLAAFPEAEVRESRRKPPTVPVAMGARLRLLVYELFAEKRRPTVSLLMQEAQARWAWPFSRSTLHRTLQRLGFRFRTGAENSDVAREPPAAVERRLEFLHSLADARARGAVVFYLDEATFGRPDAATLKRAAAGSSTAGGSAPGSVVGTGNGTGSSSNNGAADSTSSGVTDDAPPHEHQHAQPPTPPPPDGSTPATASATANVPLPTPLALAAPDGSFGPHGAAAPTITLAGTAVTSANPAQDVGVVGDLSTTGGSQQSMLPSLGMADAQPHPMTTAASATAVVMSHFPPVPPGGSKGDRITVCQLASEQHGILRDAGLLYHSKKRKDSDAGGGDIDSDRFMRWMREAVFPVLKKFDNPLLVLDRAVHHMTPSASPSRPSARMSKHDLAQWLVANHIEPHATLEQWLALPKLQLYAKCRESSTSCSHLVEQEARSHGISILYTPPLHPDLNPLEQCWEVIRAHIARATLALPRGQLPQLETCIKQGLDASTTHLFATAVDETLRVEQRYLAILEQADFPLASDDEGEEYDCDELS